MWERGLKLRWIHEQLRHIQSLPMWERGLKHGFFGVFEEGGLVAPHVGAWIETFGVRLERAKMYVAPHVGAWIETHSLQK